MKITALFMIMMGSFNAVAAELPEDVSAKNIIRQRIQDNAHRYKIEAARGDVKAQFHLGELYHWGMGVRKDISKALELYNSASQNGNRDASHKLGAMYHFGRSVKRNPTTSLQYYRRAALQGHWEAQCLLAEFYFTGNIRGLDAVTEKYLICACTFYELAVAQKLPLELHDIGLAYHKQLLVLPEWNEPLDLPVIFNKFEKAIDWIWDLSFEGHVENTKLSNMCKEVSKKLKHFESSLAFSIKEEDAYIQTRKRIEEMEKIVKDLIRFIYSEPQENLTLTKNAHI